MKLILIFLLFISSIKLLTKQENEDLSDLAKKLYEVEDKVDHLLYHFSHDVTRHEYQASDFGTFLVPSPKNINSIHQKLKVIDHLNQQMGHPGTLRVMQNNALNMGLIEPAVSSIRGSSHSAGGLF